MKRHLSAAIAACLVMLTAVPASATEPGTSVNFEQIGHNPLYGRGMNAAPALYGRYLYVGNRTDGSPQHPHAGILVVDVADPAKPVVVGEVGQPHAANVAETTRELRVWPEQKLLIVMSFQCSEAIHACSGAGIARSHVTPTLRFFDLTGDKARAPELIATYDPPFVPGQNVNLTRLTPHEMFLWTDPKRPGRALLAYSTPSSNTGRPNLVVTDISDARRGRFTDLVQWKGTALFSETDRASSDIRLHSMGMSVDGTRTYLAYLGGGFLVLDTSDLAAAKPRPAVRLVTPVERRVSWGNPGAHSAVKVPGRALALTTDEVYGDLLDPVTGDDHGCPWGWVRVVDIADESRPKVIGEYRIEENRATYCQTARGSDRRNTLNTSYASHNPTLVGDLAFISWHSGGLQAVSLADPKAPKQTGVFTPTPLDSVTTEDPALSAGPDKVVAWSYPIISDGLIYLIDIRNGLYVLRYTGPGRERVAAVRFLEGNSTLGDAGRLESRVLGTKRSAPRTPARSDGNLPSTGLGPVAVAGLALLLLAVLLALRLEEAGTRRAVRKNTH